MTLEEANQLIEAINEDSSADDEAKIMEGYSGRFMNGQETIAVKCANRDLAFYAAGVAGMDFRKLRTDNLGRGYVIY